MTASSCATSNHLASNVAVSLNYELTREPDDADTRLLAKGLNTHAVAEIGKDGFKPVAIFVRDENGEIQGGVSAYLNWNWLQVSLLWVAEDLRGAGIGTQLLSRIETVAREEGCDRAHVSTFSFQAATFYEAHGFTGFATLDDYPPGQAKHFLKKDL